MRPIEYTRVSATAFTGMPGTLARTARNAGRAAVVCAALLAKRYRIRKKKVTIEAAIAATGRPVRAVALRCANQVRKPTCRSPSARATSVANQTRTFQPGLWPPQPDPAYAPGQDETDANQRS